MTYVCTNFQNNSRKTVWRILLLVQLQYMTDVCTNFQNNSRKTVWRILLLVQLQYMTDVCTNFQNNSRKTVWRILQQKITWNWEIFQKMTKLKGRQFMNQGELTLENYMLHKFSIWLMLVQIFKIVAVKL